MAEQAPIPIDTSINRDDEIIPAPYDGTSVIADGLVNRHRFKAHFFGNRVVDDAFLTTANSAEFDVQGPFLRFSLSPAYQRTIFRDSLDRLGFRGGLRILGSFVPHRFAAVVADSAYVDRRSRHSGSLHPFRVHGFPRASRRDTNDVGVLQLAVAAPRGLEGCWHS